MSTSTNPKGVILHDDKTEIVKAVVPDEIKAKEGEVVEWVVLPSHLPVTVTFSSETGSPFDSPLKGRNPKGKVKKGAGGFILYKDYKYTVEDNKGNKIDPHLRVRK